MASLLGIFLQALFGSLFDWLKDSQADRARMEAVRDKGVADANAETQTIVAQVADERAQVRDPDSVGALIDELRRKAGADPRNPGGFIEPPGA